jgi:hypothetical protein
MTKDPILSARSRKVSTGAKTKSMTSGCHTRATVQTQSQNNRRELLASRSSRCVVTLPLWLGCAVLCTILVGIVGFAPFFATESSNDTIIGTVIDLYTTLASAIVATVLDKTVNELIFMFLGLGQANFSPFEMTAVNFSDPSWDRKWQLFFLGVGLAESRAYFYYMDLATGAFTGQFPNGTETLRIIGNAHDVDFTAHRRSATLHLQFEPVANVSMNFPPYIVFTEFLAQNAPVSLLFTLDTQGNMVYGYGITVTSPLTSPAYAVPVGILLQLLPFEDMYNPTTGNIGGDSVLLDNFGGLVGCSLPQVASIYLPVGTPGAVCETVVYDNRATSRCRHSLATLAPLWPALGAAHAAYFSNFDPPTVENSTLDDVKATRKNFSSAVFYYDDTQYLVAGASLQMPSGRWWAAAITPTHTKTIYGPYLENRNRVVLIVALVCGGMALLVLATTYILMRPLSTLMHNMIAA